MKLKDFSILTLSFRFHLESSKTFFLVWQCNDPNACAKLLTNSRHENQDRDHLRAKNPKREVRSGSCNVSITPEA